LTISLFLCEGVVYCGDRILFGWESVKCCEWLWWLWEDGFVFKALICEKNGWAL